MGESGLQLSCGALSALVAPDAGGSLAAFSAHGQEMMRQAVPPTSSDALDMACYPLVPFSNRIANGRFRFADRTISLAPAPESPPHALHGIGWRRPWKVASASGRRIELALRHDGDEWPWPFEARETFDLDGSALTIALTLCNRADEPMPAGLGLHPFFPGPAEAKLRADLPYVWETTADKLPIRRVDTPAAWDFAQGRAIAGLDLDTCFSGSGGSAQDPISIEWPNRAWALSIESRGAGHAIIYAPPDRDFFCVEPVSHVPDAVNRPESADATGLRILGPGEEMALACRFAVVPR